MKENCGDIKQKRDIKLLIASPRGFCAGVSRAVEIVERAVEKYGIPMYVRHQIVHNSNVIKYLESKGVTFVEDLAEIPDGSRVIFSAHGSKAELFEEAKSKNLHVIDATCPLVLNVHKNAIKLENDGAEVIIIGHKDHVEVIGTSGQLHNGCYIVATEDEIQDLQVKDPDNIGYVTQTTLNFRETQSLIRKLKERFPKLKDQSKSNICYATQNRQDAVLKMMNDIDQLIIVGSRNSSNATRLMEIGLGCKNGSLLVDSASDLIIDWFDLSNVVGLSAGASTPENVIQDFISWFKDNFNVTVEEVKAGEENVSFPIPKELRRITHLDNNQS